MLESVLSSRIILDQPDWLTDINSWHEHIPFAFWCVETCNPRVVVELGTHKGDSYCAFCQAVQRVSLGTRCYAVDTWEGDPQAGHYGEEVFERLRAYHDIRYGSFSRLLRTTFDDALRHFADRSIDVLHIDGLHTYEAVRHDFETWLPKLSEVGIVLFHDITVRESDFGVWRFWEEISRAYPSFSFLHGHGLGVLAVGKTIPDGLKELCSNATGAVETARKWFAALGQAVSHAYPRSPTEELQRSLSTIESAKAEADSRIGRPERELQREAALRRDLIAILSDEAAKLREYLKHRESELAQARRLVQQTQETLGRITGSLSWRMTQPLRHMSTSFPRGWRVLKGAGKILYWTTTLQLRERLRRRRIFRLLLDSGLFDTDFYLRQYPDVLESGVSPLEHFYLRGIAERRNPNPFFDTSFYLSQDPDVALAGGNPVLHYLRYGFKEGRDPSRQFSGNLYYEMNPDVAALGANPLSHFLKYGASEGRRVPVPSDAHGFLPVQDRPLVAPGTSPAVSQLKNCSRLPESVLSPPSTDREGDPPDVPTAGRRQDSPAPRAPRMKRILLVNPHETEQSGFTNPPLGLLYLAGSLRHHGFEARLVDACVEGKAAVLEALQAFRPAIVAITCLTPGRKKALELAELAKSVDPDATVVLGGAHPTIMFRQILEHYPSVDVVVLGEGEQTIVELARGLDLAEIRGVAYRVGGKVVRTRHRENVPDLDALPFPAWDLVNFGKYQARGQGTFRRIDLAREPRVSVIFSRGCSGHCDFCSTWWIWKGWRHRSARNMVDELEELHRRHGIRHFCFADDALTIDRAATLALCAEILARGLKIAFHATTRTDAVDEEVLRKLAEAGCYQISFGVESGSQAILERMGKANDVASAERAIRLARKCGLAVTALVIIGNVGETEETVLDTIRFLQRTEPTDVGCVGGLWILPGTKLYRECKKRGFIDDDFWLSDEPCKVYTLEWPLATLQQMEQLVTNFRQVRLPGLACHEPSAPASSFVQKWQRYVRPEVNEYSATTEWADAQAQHVELMAKLPKACRNVLDLGCGDGWSTNRLRELGKNVTGVTITPGEADHARRRYGLELVVCDMHDLRLPDHAFDAIYCRESYEHTAAPFVALCEMNRVLCPRGHVLLNIPWEDWIREDSHYSVLTPSQMREMFFKCRFVVEDEGRTELGHYWYLARKVAEVGAPHPFPPPRPGRAWLDGRVIGADAAPERTRAARAPRIIGMIRVKNEERWIGAALEKACPLVDGFVILDDGSTDGTPEECRAHPRVLRYEYQQERTTDEARDKDRLLQWTLDEDPDWILALDGDELLEDAAPELLRRAIAGCPPDVTAFGLNFLYMWDAHDRHRVDGKYANLRHARLFRVSGLAVDARSLRFTTTTHGANFHCGSVPANLPGRVQFLDVNVKHYGYVEREQRARKRAFYERLDPRNAAAGYYDHLTSEVGIILAPWHERVPLTYQSERHPVLKRNGEVFSAADWLAALTAHIPNAGEHFVRYYGW